MSMAVIFLATAMSHDKDLLKSEFMDGEKDFVRYCTHCSNKAPQSVLFKYEILDEETFSSSTLVEYFLVKCATCNMPSLYVRLDADFGITDDDAIDILGTRVYPKIDSLSESVPINIRDVYSKTLKILKINPEAFCVQIRRLLEFVCIDKGIKGKNLDRMLKEMTEKGLIPKVLSEMSNNLRVLGNLGAHALENVEITSYDASLANDFFRAIIEYVYVAPGKVDSFKKRLGEMQNRKSDNTTPF